MNRTTIENFRNNRLSQEELAEFIKWIDSAPESEIFRVLSEDMESFEEKETVETELRELQSLTSLKERLFDKKSRGSVWRKVAAVAACLLIPVLIFGNIYLYKKLQSTPELVSQISTNKERFTTVSLPDGSSVELNHDSRICYTSSDFSDEVRTINFEGEGFFHIAKDKEHPFKIKAKEVEVTVHGTEFNFRAYERSTEAKLTLVEGAVTMTSMKSGESVSLVPMDEAVVDYSSGKISVKKMSDVSATTAWTEGRLRFDNAEMTDVILDIEECYGCHLSISRNLAGQHYTGVIPTNNIMLAISILEKVYNVKITVRE